MHIIWLYTLLSVFIVSLVSLIGLVTLGIRINQLKKILLFLVSFAAGALLGGTFIHLLPEAAQNGFTMSLALSLLAGILLFFVLEKIIHWRHCHEPTSKKHPHPVGMMNLIGDGFHNFIDGMLIAGAYLAGTKIGIATTVAVLLHEIPQEIGDFGVLLHAGYTKAKALLFNFFSALTAVLGAVVVLIIGLKAINVTELIVPFTAGGFIYIAGADLIPELHKETKPWKSLLQLVGIVLGISLMALLLLLE